MLSAMNVTGKSITSETRRNLAETYAQYLALEPLAAKAGLDNTARFAEIMRWWRYRARWRICIAPLCRTRARMFLTRTFILITPSI